MLGRTAGGLYWMFRYLERSENIARLVAAGQRIALTRSSSAADEWASVLTTAAVRKAYDAKYDDYAQDTVIDFMLRDPDNPSSVLTAIETARNNARSVRTALTREVWEAVNECWMVLKDAMARKVPERDVPRLLQTIRQRSAFVRGAMHGTMLRNEIYDFARAGTYLERAESTARILDVKYYVLLPSAAPVGSQLDNVQWEIILRSVSAQSAFRWCYGDNSGPLEIAEFLMLDRRLPRSLAFCCDKIADNLQYLAKDYGQRHPCHDMAEALRMKIHKSTIEEIFEIGLHERIQEFLRDATALGRQIELDYSFYG